jgi:hypothetical protein
VGAASSLKWAWQRLLASCGVAVLDTYINDDALLERLFAAAPFTRGTGEGGAPVREREGRQRERRIEECCGMGKGCAAVRKKIERTGHCPLISGIGG